MADVLDRGAGELVPVPGSALVTPAQDLSLARDPVVVLQEAQRAATALKNVIDNKARPVRFNNETYLEFEDWQTVGRFYGITAKVTETRPVEFGEVRGFEARAVAVHAASGIEVSAADSMCLSDEQNWKGKPLFQLRSMAQTRACGKALRNVLSWVVVLAGYKPTPAEEMDGVIHATAHTAHAAKCKCGKPITTAAAQRFAHMGLPPMCSEHYKEYQMQAAQTQAAPETVEPRHECVKCHAPLPADYMAQCRANDIEPLCEKCDAFADEVTGE